LTGRMAIVGTAARSGHYGTTMTGTGEW
jgi:hypothetical protein